MRKNKIGGNANRRRRRGVRHPRLNYSHNIIKDECVCIDYSKKQRPEPTVRTERSIATLGYRVQNRFA